MLFNPFTMANRNGIPRIEATGVSVGTSSVVFNFQKNAFYNKNFAGLILFKLPSYAAPTSAVPVVFNTNGEQQEVTTYGEVQVTSAMLNKAGIYLAFYDGNTLQFLTDI